MLIAALKASLDACQNQKCQCRQESPFASTCTSDNDDDDSIGDETDDERDEIGCDSRRVQEQEEGAALPVELGEGGEADTSREAAAAATAAAASAARRLLLASLLERQQLQSEEGARLERHLTENAYRLRAMTAELRAARFEARAAAALRRRCREQVSPF